MLIGPINSLMWAILLAMVIAPETTIT